MKFLTTILLLNFLSFISCSDCNSRKTCGDCMGYTDERCVWCSQDNITVARCQPATMDNIEKWCDTSMIYNPTAPFIKEENANFSSSIGKEIQFRPQKLHIKVRPGVPVHFKMSYKPSVDFPLDVYFLMDYSYTMESYSTQLKDQARTIYEKLEKMTKNVRLGMGSFIEKPALPYVKNPKTYTFKNHLKLSKDMFAFQSVLNNSKFSGNLDDPEAGLDALMQVMTCIDEIGWRDNNNSRRIIVLITDATYHSAGDGKMVGAYKLNDMKCHLKNDEYVKDASLLYDYPSVSQINHVASQGNFKIIFAATTTVMNDYSALADHILNAKYAQLNSNNTLDIIERAYKELVKNVKLNYVTPPSVTLEIDQICDVIPKHNCESVPLQEQVDIPATLKVMNCISETGSDKNFWIKPLGINDQLNIHLEIDCSCPCELGTKVDESCSYAGSNKCGVCVCDKNKGGDKCQYNCTDENAGNLSEKCKYKNDKNLCSGHGTCRCGICESCAPGYSGDFCQYSEDQCPRSNGYPCANKGECKYNKCVCKKGWSGEVCTCSDDIKDCISPFSSKICSGRGNCICGECKCNSVPGKNENYTGVFCDNCAECTKETCDNLAPYAICNYDHEKSQCDRNFNQTNEIIVLKVNRTEIDSQLWGPTHKCIVAHNETNLIFKYQVFEETKRVRLLIQIELEEIPKAHIWIAAGSTIGAVLLIGLITGIVWKVLIDLYDKKEYEKFCKEAKGEGYDVSENPLYRVPDVNFVNPAYNGAS